MKKPRSTKHMFLVELVLPPGMTSTNMCHYIEQAIQCEVGYAMPEEPMHHLDRDTIVVKNAGKVLMGIKNAIEDLRSRQWKGKSNAN